MNPKAPLKAEDVEALAREAPQALVHLVMVMQEQLVELRVLGIEVLDRVIIGHGRHLSFRDAGAL